VIREAFASGGVESPRVGLVHGRHRSANCKPWSNCGRRYRTRCASSMPCEKRRDQGLTSIGRSKRRCASSCNRSVREVRKQLKQQIPEASPAEAEQLSVVDDDAASRADRAERRRDVAVPVSGGGLSPRIGRSGSQPAAAGKKGAAVSPSVAKTSGSPQDHCRRTGRLGEVAGAGEAHAPVGPGCRAHPGRQLGQARITPEQCQGRAPFRSMAQDLGLPLDRRHTQSTRAGVSGAVPVGALQPALTSHPMLRSPRVPTDEQRDGTEYSRSEARAIAASAAARTGTTIFCVTGAAWRITSGGRRTRPGGNSCSSRPPDLIAPIGESFAMRPKPPRASNSSAFAFATSAGPISPR
jgi:hypothetical protein